MTRKRNKGFVRLARRQNKMTIKIGLKFKLKKRDWTLTGFREGLPLITCKKTGQVQRLKDKDLLRLAKAKT